VTHAFTAVPPILRIEQVLARLLLNKWRKCRSLYDRPPTFEIGFVQSGKVSPRGTASTSTYSEHKMVRSGNVIEQPREAKKGG
jgi:hypothetical protein